VKWKEYPTLMKEADEDEFEDPREQQGGRRKRRRRGGKANAGSEDNVGAGSGTSSASSGASSGATSSSSSTTTTTTTTAATATTTLPVGTAIRARWTSNDATLYSGKISRVNSDGTYDITFDDGDKRKSCPLNEMNQVVDPFTLKWNKIWARCRMAGWTERRVSSRTCYFRPGKQKSSLVYDASSGSYQLKPALHNVGFYETPQNMLSHLSDKEKIRFDVK
jgi:hypothetical protein